MPKPAKRRLIEAALQAQQCAVAPYSGFKVGAALLAQNGKVFSGVNVESVSFGLTCCAERVALFKALSEGERQFAAVAIVAAVEAGPMPCGACRQLLIEYAPAAVVWVADSRDPGAVIELTVAELLPSPFLPQFAMRKADEDIR